MIAYNLVRHVYDIINIVSMYTYEPKIGNTLILFMGLRI